jgi:hypothetical protein
MSKQTQARIAAALSWIALLAGTLAIPTAWDSLAALPLFIAVGMVLGSPAYTAQQWIGLRSRIAHEGAITVAHIYESSWQSRPVILTLIGTTNNQWMAELAAEAEYISAVPTRVACEYEVES